MRNEIAYNHDLDITYLAQPILNILNFFSDQEHLFKKKTDRWMKGIK